MSQDPYDTAASTEIGPKKYFGQLFTDAFFVYISKGEAKVVFDPAQHSPSKKFTQFKIDGLCSRSDGSTYTIAREIICEFGREWAGIVLPSLKKLNVHPRDLNERWASWERVPTGRKWQNDAGETVDTLTFKFTQFFDSEDACRAAEAAFYNRSTEPVADPLNDSHPMPEEEAEDVDKVRANLAGFLPALWTAAQGNPEAFYQMIASQTETLAVHFDSNSPEVVALVESGAA